MKICYPYNFFTSAEKYAIINSGIHKHLCWTITVELKFINTNQLEVEKNKVNNFMMNKFSILTYFIISLLMSLKETHEDNINM